jgi:hypothetical protein
MPIKLKVNYFAHDYGARYNPKLVSLQIAMGAVGLALFWCLIEMLWENAGYYPCVYESITYHLHWATPDDVRRVVEEFDLFKTDGKVFWSDSVLKRMDIRNSISEKRANSGRAGGLQSGVSRREKAIASGNGSNAEASASDSGSNKEVKEINETKNDKIKESHNLTEEEEKRMIFELFFWDNIVSPEYELDRFWRHYEKTEWTTSDGVAIENKERVAKYWKPEKKGSRFIPEFLKWYKGVILAAKNHLSTDEVEKMLKGLTRVVRDGNSWIITFSSKELAQMVSTFVHENNLYCGCNKIYWKFED